MSMFNLGALASISTVLNSMDSAAKETIEDINKTVTIIASNGHNFFVESVKLHLQMRYFLIDGIAAVQNSPQLTATQIRAHNKMASSTNVQAKVEIIVLEGRPIE